MGDNHLIKLMNSGGYSALLCMEEFSPLSFLTSDVVEISDWFSALRFAIQSDLEDCVRLLISDRLVKATCDNKDGAIHALCLLAMLNDVSGVNMLVRCGADIDDALRFLTLCINDAYLRRIHGFINRIFQSELANDTHTYCKYLDGSKFNSRQLLSHVQMIELFITNGAELNKPDQLGNSLLMKACEKGSKDIVVRILLKHGADANAKNILGQTALTVSVYGGHMDMVKILIEEGGANVKVLTTKQSSVLMFVPSDRPDLAELLLEHDCDVATRNAYGQTALMRVLHTRTQVSRELVLLLLSHNKQLVNVSDNEGNTPLMLAAATQSCLTVDILLDAGADVNAINKDGKSSLLLAVEHAKTEHMLPVCGRLLGRGKAQVKDELFLAILKGQTQVVEEMLEAGCLPSLFLFKDCCFSSQVFLLHHALTYLKLSPLTLAFVTKNTRLIHLFLGCNFLTHLDIKLPHILYCTVERHLLQDKADNCLELFQSIYSRPWSLHTLSLVQVSGCLGSTRQRADRLAATGLPMALQRLLMYTTHNDKTELGVPCGL